MLKTLRRELLHELQHIRRCIQSWLKCSEDIILKLHTVRHNCGFMHYSDVVRELELKFEKIEACLIYLWFCLWTYANLLTDSSNEQYQVQHHCLTVWCIWNLWRVCCCCCCKHSNIYIMSFNVNIKNINVTIN